MSAIFDSSCLLLFQIRRTSRVSQPYEKHTEQQKPVRRLSEAPADRYESRSESFDLFLSIHCLELYVNTKSSAQERDREAAYAAFLKKNMDRVAPPAAPRVAPPAPKASKKRLCLRKIQKNCYYNLVYSSGLQPSSDGLQPNY